jgi:hypothetical protein
MEVQGVSETAPRMSIKVAEHILEAKRDYQMG